MAKEKKNTKSAQTLGKKFEQEKTEVGIKHNIRVSSPYGYYPEDVDKIILQLEHDVSTLTKENKKLSDDLHSEKEQSSRVKNELTKIKMQVSLMEIPDVSTEESFAMMSRVGTITGQNVELPITEISDEELKQVPKITTVSAPVSPTKNKEQPTTYSNLVKPKIKI